MWRSFLECGYAELITSGCDSRLSTQSNGLNRYGCSCLPRHEVAFGSCSCSSPSPRGTAAAEQLIVALRSTQTPKWIVADAIEHVRDSLRSYMELPDESDIALTPSGTDAELLAVALADRSPERPILNIVVGPTEVGSGTVRAASGAHYDSCVPRGGTAKPGTPVDRGLHRRIRAHSIDIREPDGTARHPASLDAEVLQLVSEAVDGGQQVLLHAVAHSKTGHFAPRLETIRRLREQLPNDVTVIVDAAQGRLGESFGTVSISQLVRWGCIVNFTGSKFFGGPPFSAALIVPRLLRVHERTRGLPLSFGSYFSRAEMPKSWTAIRQSMDSWINIPAIVRWTAAIAEIRAFESVPRQQRQEIMRGFERSAMSRISEQAELQLLPPFEHGLSDWADPESHVASTVISFGVHAGSNRTRRLDRHSLAAIHRALNCEQQSLPVQLGQPVAIAPEYCVLRIALGAPLLVRIAQDQTLGPDLTTRLNWLDGKLRTTAERIVAEIPNAAIDQTQQDAQFVTN